MKLVLQGWLALMAMLLMACATLAGFALPILLIVVLTDVWAPLGIASAIPLLAAAYVLGSGALHVGCQLLADKFGDKFGMEELR